MLKRNRGRTATYRKKNVRTDLQSKLVPKNQVRRTDCVNFLIVCIVEYQIEPPPGLVVTGVQSFRAYLSEDCGIPCLNILYLCFFKDLTPCMPNPCHNGGTCTEGTEAGSYVCTCDEVQWTGTHCDIGEYLICMCTYTRDAADRKGLNEKM